MCKNTQIIILKWINIYFRENLGGPTISLAFIFFTTWDIQQLFKPISTKCFLLDLHDSCQFIYHYHSFCTDYYTKLNLLLIVAPCALVDSIMWAPDCLEVKDDIKSFTHFCLLIFFAAMNAFFHLLASTFSEITHKDLKKPVKSEHNDIVWSFSLADSVQEL